MTENREMLTKLVLKAVGCDRLRSGEIADHLIANGVVVSKNETTTQRWISVEDEKPKHRGHYFISYVFRCSDIRFYGEAMWHDDMEGNGYVTGPHFSNEGMDGMRVTHWMEIPRIPLSKPPKEGE